MQLLGRDFFYILDRFGELREASGYLGKISCCLCNSYLKNNLLRHIIYLIEHISLIFIYIFNIHCDDSFILLHLKYNFYFDWPMRLFSYDLLHKDHNFVRVSYVDDHVENIVECYFFA